MSSGRWRIAFALTTVCATILLLHSDLPVSRILPFQDVVQKTAALRGDMKSPGSHVSTDEVNANPSLESDIEIPAMFIHNKSDATTRDGSANILDNQRASDDQQKNAFQETGVKMSLTITTSTATNKSDNSLSRQDDGEEYPNVHVAGQVDVAYENFMKDCSSLCLTQVQKHKERWGGDLLNIVVVKRLVVEARKKMIARFKVDYGEDNFDKIFQVDGKSRGRTAFVSANAEDGVSIKRFKRKLKMKILSMQAAIQAERESLKETSRRTSLAEHALIPSLDHYERMVWATGGHSASAGHGNLFNESYTAFMDRAITDVFGAIGIDFEGRNYAMGGAASAPEIALCSEQIFGTDADVISWDYGMTDGNWFFRQAMYEQRIGLNPNRPAIVGLSVGGSLFPARIRIHQRVEEWGLTAIYLDPEEFDAMEEQFPDTFGLTSEQIDAMPRMVKHYKCQGNIEKGDPTCDAKKYDNDDVCPERPGMASWHPGWKRQALWGNIMALFLSDMLIDSISELGSTSNRTKLLDDLQREEDTDYREFIETSAASPDLIEYNMVPLDNDLVTSGNVSVFFRSPSICHTARLPAQSRYLGILTESEPTGVEDYYKGVSMEEAKSISSDTTTMPLVYDENDRVFCEAELQRDHFDYFFVSNKMGPANLTIPNEAERQAYGRESEKLNGIIVVCSVPCPWGKCPEGEWQLDAIQNGTVNLHVNDKPVTDVTDFAGCGVLRGADGHRWQPNEADQYVVRASVSGNLSTLAFLRISSLIVL